MKVGASAFLFTLLTITTGVAGFIVSPTCVGVSSTATFAETVEVCGFKDCRRAGGGARLEKLVKKVVEERGLSITVEGCDCQGECGYGPNLVVDGKLINGVRGEEAVIKALEIEE